MDVPSEMSAAKTEGRKLLLQKFVAALLAIVASVGPERASATPAVPQRMEQDAGAVRPVAIFGADDRIRTPASMQSTVDKIGVLIDLDRKLVCTAFCVAENVAMTAAHCLFPSDGASSGHPGSRLAAIRFRSRIDQRRGEARIAGTLRGRAHRNIATGKTALSLRPPIDAVDDWALLRLDRNACPAGGLALSRRPTEDILVLAREGRIYNIAVHRDFEGFAPALAAPCTAARDFGDLSWETISRDFRQPENLIFHACDTGGSSSGSPLLYDGPTGPEVVAINVGTYLHASGGIPQEDKSSGSTAPPARREIANTAIAAHRVAAAVDSFVDAGMPLRRHEIRAVRHALARLGYAVRSFDGAASATLAAAIRSYQLRSGIPANGRLSRQLYHRLVPAAIRPMAP